MPLQHSDVSYTGMLLLHKSFELIGISSLKTISRAARPQFLYSFLQMLAFLLKRLISNMPVGWVRIRYFFMSFIYNIREKRYLKGFKMKPHQIHELWHRYTLGFKKIVMSWFYEQQQLSLSPPPHLPPCLVRGYFRIKENGESMFRN